MWSQRDRWCGNLQRIRAATVTLDPWGSDSLASICLAASCPALAGPSAPSPSPTGLFATCPHYTVPAGASLATTGILLLLLLLLVLLLLLLLLLVLLLLFLRSNKLFRSTRRTLTVRAAKLPRPHSSFGKTSCFFIIKYTTVKDKLPRPLPVVQNKLRKLIWLKVFYKGGRWECHCKYIEENWLSYFDSMKSTDRCIIAVVALRDCQEVMAARIHLLVHWMGRKYLKQFCSMYLKWHSQRPSYYKIGLVE